MSLGVKLKGETQEEKLISKHSYGGLGQISLSLQEHCVYLFAKVALAGDASEHPDLHFSIGREIRLHKI